MSSTLPQGMQHQWDEHYQRWRFWDEARSVWVWEDGSSYETAAQPRATVSSEAPSVQIEDDEYPISSQSAAQYAIPSALNTSFQQLNIARMRPLRQLLIAHKLTLTQRQAQEKIIINLKYLLLQIQHKKLPIIKGLTRVRHPSESGYASVLTIVGYCLRPPSWFTVGKVCNREERSKNVLLF